MNSLIVDQKLSKANFDLVPHAKLMNLIFAEYPPYIFGMFMIGDVCQMDFFACITKLEQKLWLFIVAVLELVIVFGVNFEAWEFG